MRIRVRKGVVLSAGGFTYNRTMMAKTAPDYLQTAPLGTIADDGSGIKLGMTVGAKTDLLDRISAWRFLYPPESWTNACSVGPNGERLVGEEMRRCAESTSPWSRIPCSGRPGSGPNTTGRSGRPRREGARASDSEPGG